MKSILGNLEYELVTMSKAVSVSNFDFGKLLQILKPEFYLIYNLEPLRFYFQTKIMLKHRGNLEDVLGGNFNSNEEYYKEIS